jgi:outer membrane beta-barrel protein
MRMHGLAIRLTFVLASFVGTAFSIAQDQPPADAPATSSAPADTSAAAPAVPAPEEEKGAAASSSGGESSGENTYDQMDQQTDDAAKKEESATPAPEQAKEKLEAAAKLTEAKTLTDLNQLQPFSDIAVIQRRFLPKTHRFELSAIGQTNLNNPFFNSFGGSAKIAYYFTEKWAVEGIGTGLAIASRQVTDDLRNSATPITTSNTVTARSFFGAAVKWNPIYGKVSFLNHAIVPFDLNFSLGGGVTGTDRGFEEPTVHLGTSQIFALNKSFGIRWDIDWNFYQANAVDSVGNPIKIFNNDLFIGIGISFYFPGATYR